MLFDLLVTAAAPGKPREARVGACDLACALRCEIGLGNEGFRHLLSSSRKRAEQMTVAEELVPEVFVHRCLVPNGGDVRVQSVRESRTLQFVDARLPSTISFSHRLPCNDLYDGTL